MANTLWSTPSTELNEVQRKAIRKALKYRFQLIQGPPGQYFNINEKESKLLNWFKPTVEPGLPF